MGYGVFHPISVAGCCSLRGYGGDLLVGGIAFSDS